MGFLDSLFGKDDGPSPKKIARHVSVLQTRHGEPARRYESAEKLVAWGTREAVDGLLLRFTVTAEKETSDEDEKVWLAEALQKLDADVLVPAIERYLRREAFVNWPLRILGKITTKDDFRDKIVAVLADLDIHFDRNPERKVEILHALMEQASDPTVGEATAPFLDDTDDTVRIAAAELLVSGGDERWTEPLVDALAGSGDRPRVRAALCAALAEHGWSVAGRKAEIEPLLPEGYYLTRQGSVKRLGQ